MPDERKAVSREDLRAAVFAYAAAPESPALAAYVDRLLDAAEARGSRDPERSVRFAAYRLRASLRMTEW